MKLTLLRHAQTEGSLHELYYGASDIPAMESALQELHDKAAIYPKALHYYTSGLLRTEQTLCAIYGDVPHIRLPGLQEMDFGDFEMRSYEELVQDPAFLEWEKDSDHLPCPHGESLPQLIRRNVAAIGEVLATGEDSVCILHGGVTANLMVHWFGKDRHYFYRRPGTGYTVFFEEGKPVDYIPVPEA